MSGFPDKTVQFAPARPAVDLVSAGGMTLLLGLQARLQPGALAVSCGEASLSYGELDSRAWELARILNARGIGPGCFVGLVVERSLEQVIGLWGIIHCGAAYVPIDPAYPQDRLDHMISAAGITTVVTTGRHAGRFPGSGLVLIDEACGGPGTHEGAPIVTTEDPLYAIFTSGSTGLPKAAAVLRRGFANLLRWYLREFSFGPDDRTLVITSPAFDLTQKNLSAPLLAGGRLVLDVAEQYDIARIRGLIRSHGITVMNCTPSAFYPLLDAAAPAGFGDLASLRLVVLGGEPIIAGRLREWLCHPSCRAEVANTYGPTECTDICAFHRLHRGNLDGHPFVPLGGPIDGVQVEVLDGQLRPVAAGETGELCIGGAGVGPGYLHDPGRTADRFVPNPLPGRLGGKVIYRTGDLVRRHADGVLEFRGRLDHQAKIRGNRVEPGEVEAVLARHDGVRAAVVLAVEHAAGDHRLVAWVESAAAGDPPSAADMQAYLAARLPDYMVPRDYHHLDSFPLTPNGKVDRLALAGQHAKPGRAVVSAAAPAATEARIMGTWSSVLGREIADPTANFFDLGATSIDLAVVHARLGEEFGRVFPITEMFAHPTVRSLGQFLAPRAEDRPAANRPADRARQQQQAFARLRRAPVR